MAAAMPTIPSQGPSNHFFETILEATCLCSQLQQRITALRAEVHALEVASVAARYRLLLKQDLHVVPHWHLKGMHDAEEQLQKDLLEKRQELVRERVSRRMAEEKLEEVEEENRRLLAEAAERDLKETRKRGKKGKWGGKAARRAVGKFFRGLLP
ncbi:hypothetical protein ABW19_dt0202612 [Dactylella cylindrospora]|nr:hypothetical protein ABW19_dt0202612 [Dactylella cylindrospora]